MIESQTQKKIQKQAKTRIQQKSIEKNGQMLIQDQEAIMFSSLYSISSIAKFVQ